MSHLTTLSYFWIFPFIFISLTRAGPTADKFFPSDLSLIVFYPGVYVTDYIASDSSTCHSQSLTRNGGVNHGRLALVGGTLLSSMVAIHIYQQNGWWKDNRAPFHFQEDLVYGLSVDKIGHFYGGYLLGMIIQRSVEWADVSTEQALWIGSVASALFQTYVELEDGFSTWGFDRVDFAADVAGSAWLITRYYVTYLQNFDLKLSYHPSDLLGNPGGVGFKGQKHLIIDDYEGQTFWMSLKVHNILPPPIQQYWPSFLCLAAGYGARDIAGTHPHQVYFLSIDYDLTKIIPQNTGFLKTLGEALNFIHLPAPTVQLSPEAIWYGLYF